MVAVGVALLVIGVGPIAAISFLNPPYADTKITQFPHITLSPGASWTALLDLVNPARENLTLTWTASGPADVALYPAPGCTNPSGAGCRLGPALWSWPNATTGTGSEAGTFSAPLVVSAVSRAASSLGFSGSVRETYTSGGPTLPPVTELLIALAAGALVAIGAVTLFLGLFLRPGVYRGSRPLVSRSAEDAALIAALIEEHERTRARASNDDSPADEAAGAPPTGPPP